MWDTRSPYAIADIHGELTLLRTLLHRIPTTAAPLIFLGDYIDRGEDALGTVLFLASLAQERECVFLRGNHDAAWLEVWTGERFRHCPAIPGARALWESQHGHIPSVVGAFLARTQIDWEDAWAYYSHAGAAPEVSFRRTPAEIKLWGDSRFLASPYDWGKPVIFGHYELPEPLVTATQIGIDTAAYRTGILTALDVPHQQVVQVRR